MKARLKKILFFQHVAWIGGSAGSLAQIVRHVRSQYEVHVVLCMDGPARGILESLGAKVQIEPGIVPFCGAFSGEKNLWLNQENRRGFLHYKQSARIAQRICEQLRPDIVYLNVSVLFPVALGAKQAGVEKVVLHIREPLCFETGSLQEKIKNRIVDAYVDRLIAITDGNAADFAPGKKCEIIHNWVDFSGRDGAFDPYTAYDIPRDRKIVLVLGGRHRCKGTLIALRAASLLQRDDFTLLAPGLNSSASRVKTLIRNILDIFKAKTYGREMDRLTRSGHPKIIATLPVTAIKPLIEASSMVIFPFTQPHFSKGAIEAGALRKPVIISNTQPHLAGIRNNISGIVIPSGDETALAEAMGFLLDHPDEGARLGDGLHQLVERDFSETNSVSRILKLLSD